MSRRQLALARLSWLATAVVAVAFFAAGIPVYYRQLRTICKAAPCFNSPGPAAARVLASAGLSVEAAARYRVGLYIVVALIYVAIAAVIFWRRSDDWMALFTSFMLLTFGTLGVHHSLEIEGLLANLHPFWQVPVRVVTLLGGTSITLFLFLFPSGRFEPRWLRGPIAAWVVYQIPIALLPGSLFDPDEWPPLANLLYWAVLLGACLYAQIHRYRYVSTYRQRQQTKWVVLGIGLSMIGALAAVLLTELGPVWRPEWAPLAVAQDTSYYPFLPFLPISIGIAILRSGLYDIDIIIRRTLVYGALTGMLALLYWGTVVLLQRMVALLGGGSSQLVVVASTLAIAALFRPLHHAIQEFIDRRFYRRKYDAQRVLAAFGAVVRNEVDLDRLTGALRSVAQDTLQPAQLSLWLKSPAVPPGPALHAPRPAVRH